MTGRVRIGMIGTGFMGRTHTECLAQDPRVELAWVASRTEEGARSFADAHGYGRWTDDWRELLEVDDVDAVDITAPNALHAEMAIAAAGAGKHVIVEKPLATTLGDAERVVEAVRAAGVRAVYAENRRFAPVLTEAHERIARGELGRRSMIRINELGSGPSHADWFHDAGAAGGGSLIDLGVHGIYVLEWLMDEPVVEVGAIASFRDDGVIDETMSVSYRFSSGAVGQTMSSWIAKGGIDLRTEVFGEDGTMLLDQSRDVHGIRLYREEGGAADPSVPHLSATSGWSYPQVDALRTRGSLGAMQHVADCLADRADPLCTVEDGLRVMQIVDAVYRSAREGRRVEVPHGRHVGARA